MPNGQGHAPATGALRGVYDPSRLISSKFYNANNINDPDTCHKASGTVTYVEKYGDGDWDIYVQLDPQYKSTDADGTATMGYLINKADRDSLQLWVEARETTSHKAADMIWEVPHGDQGSTCGNGGQAFNSATGILQT